MCCWCLSHDCIWPNRQRLHSDWSAYITWASFLRIEPVSSKCKYKAYTSFRVPKWRNPWSPGDFALEPRDQGSSFLGAQTEMLILVPWSLEPIQRSPWARFFFRSEPRSPDEPLWDPSYDIARTITCINRSIVFPQCFPRASTCGEYKRS